MLKQKSKIEEKSKRIVENEEFQALLPPTFKKKYQVMSIIGKGAYGIVLKVLRMKDQVQLACKVFFKIFRDQ